MGEERPLTEFTDGVQEAETTADSADTDTAEDGDADIEPDKLAMITYRWQPDGAECSRCGAATEKQWLDGDEFACPACKSWA